MKKLTTYDITYIIRRFDLKTREDFKDFGLKLKHVGSGAFRKVYQIVGYDLVVKIPRGVGWDKAHSKTEWYAYKRLKKLKKYKFLHKYLPNMYCCSKSGTILIDKHTFKGRSMDQIHKLRTECYDIFGDSCDIYGQNVGLDKKGNLKIVDFGCFPDVIC